MARYCGACGRALDATGHDLIRDDDGNPRKANAVGWKRGRHRLAFHRVRQYVCRVRLIARSPTTGKVLPTENPQRIKELQTAYVHRARLQIGGDLYEG
jgi:hypothetical protein